MVLELLAEEFPINPQAIREGLHQVVLNGRFQQIPARVTTFLDVAHNPDSARELARLLHASACQGHTYAVVGMMADKAISEVFEIMLPQVDQWFPVNLPVARASKAVQLAAELSKLDNKACITPADSVQDALDIIYAQAEEQDRVIVFGSFITVSEALGSVH